MERRYTSATIKRLLNYIISHARIVFIVACICVLVSTAANVIGSMFIQVLVDDFIEPLLLEKNPVFKELANMLLLLAGIYLIGVMCTLAYNRLMIKVSQGCLKNIRDDMFNHMQALPIKYFDTNTHGDIMSHYTNDADTLRQFISQALPQLISCSVSVIATFIVMLRYSLILSLLVAVMSVLVFVVTKFIGGNSTRYFISQQFALADINGYIEEMIGGQKVVKVFCHEEKAKENFVKKNDALFGEAQHANKFANILMPVLAQIGNLQYVLVAMIGGYLAISGSENITTGVVVAFLTLSKSFSIPIQQISQQVSMVAMALAGAQRIFNLIDEEVETDNGYVTLVEIKEENGQIIETTEHTRNYAWKHPHGDGTLTYTKLKGDVRMVDVDFGYEENKLVLKNVTLYAEPGQKVAFVGATGAGKTTITNLINRFYDIDDGKIRYDGININKIKKADLRKSLGIVLQDTYLFTGTVMDNIRYGRLDATDEVCIAAAKLANAHGFITHLSDGYNTMLTGAGTRLSQGQRQLLAIQMSHMIGYYNTLLARIDNDKNIKKEV